MTIRALAAAFMATCLSGVAFAGTASATTGTSGNTTVTTQVTGGTLAFCSGGVPGNATFTGVTLSGVNQTTTISGGLPIQVCDGTGSGAGWNVTATSTTFTSTTPAATLPATAVTVPSAPTVACDSGAICTVATVDAAKVTYAYALPAGSTAPTATECFDANVNTGMGAQTVTFPFALAIPANTVASNTANSQSGYSSTWTFSLVTGP
jgi:hypothetical protein